MFRKILASIALTLTLSSCAALDNTVDHAADRTQQLVDETLDGVDKKLEVIVPRAAKEIGDTLDATLENFLNSDIVAFVIVGITGLLGITLLCLLLIILRWVWSKTSAKRGKPASPST